jgi:hypothetical protein
MFTKTLAVIYFKKEGMDPAFHRCGQLYGAGFHFLDLKIYYMVLGFQKKLKEGRSTKKNLNPWLKVYW